MVPDMAPSERVRQQRSRVEGSGHDGIIQDHDTICYVSILLST